MTDQISALFHNPPDGFSPIPFWWWSGCDLNPDQLKWQLDQLLEKGITSAVIGYSHLPNGELDQGKPLLWSDEWWTVFLEVLDHARSKGITLGLQDYVILNAALCGLESRGKALHCISRDLSAGASAYVEIPEQGTLIEAIAYNSLDQVTLPLLAESQEIVWTPHSEGWTLITVYSEPMGFDPLAKDSGELSLAIFQKRVAERIGDHLGSTFKIFFQDELDFHGRWPFWSDDVPAAFVEQHGYEITGRLNELWHGSSPASVKLRLDFHDTVVRLLEERYFKPLKRWHDLNGCLYGHDNAGRGAVGRGRDFYGDYMRTMRWYSAPGSDDPDLRGPRAFVGLKVASSLATLYSRPRVWAECFHSSGWGATTDQLLGATNSAFALGANLINLHGLYASTSGSWWEWAPPDFHFRQPYWACMDVYAEYVKRVSWLMSQGDKTGDVAILYPTTAIAGGLNASASPAAGATAYSEQQRGEALPELDVAELEAFRLAQAMFNGGLDVDFIDDESIENASFSGGKLRAGKGEWHTVVLTHMSAVRMATLERLREFRAAGGRVVFVGASPTATNVTDVDASLLKLLVAEIASETIEHLGDIDRQVLDRIVPTEKRYVQTRALQVVRRRIDDNEVILLLHNPSDQAFQGDVLIDGQGTVSLLDPHSGQDSPCEYVQIGPRVLQISLRVEAQRIALVRVSNRSVLPGARPVTAPETADEAVQTVELTGPWSYSLVPTLDNRYCDFLGDSSRIGLEINRLQWREGTSDWTTLRQGHAPRFQMLGPVEPCDSLDAWIRAQQAATKDEVPQNFTADGAIHQWREALISRHDGILDDPWVRNWACGPHGLKDKVPDDYIDFGENLGNSQCFVTGIVEASVSRLFVSSQAAFSLWVSGKLVAEQAAPLAKASIEPWNLPSFEAPPVEFEIEPGKCHRFFLQLSQPNSQRLRAHIGIHDAPIPTTRAQRFLADDRFSIRPAASRESGPQCYRFQAPPGRTTFSVKHHGKLSASKLGQPLAIETVALSGGWFSSRVTGGSASDRSCTVELRLEEVGELRAGDALDRIFFDDARGPIELGDWCSQGLKPFSGGIRYSTLVRIPETPKRAVLCMGEVAACCEIFVNGQEAGKLIAAPWSVDISGLLNAGDNTIVITVYNTLANHYLENTPSPYAHEDQAMSGLLQTPILRLIRSFPNNNVILEE